MMIDRFEGEYAFLSNFYESPIFYKRRLYMTAEHLFQCCKTPNPDEREAIRSAPTPGQAKRLGRKVTLRPDWNQIKLKAMLGVFLDTIIQPTTYRLNMSKITYK